MLTLELVVVKLFCNVVILELFELMSVPCCDTVLCKVDIAEEFEAIASSLTSSHSPAVI